MIHHSIHTFHLHIRQDYGSEQTLKHYVSALHEYRSAAACDKTEKATWCTVINNQTTEILILAPSVPYMQQRPSPQSIPIVHLNIQ